MSKAKAIGLACKKKKKKLLFSQTDQSVYFDIFCLIYMQEIYSFLLFPWIFFFEKPPSLKLINQKENHIVLTQLLLNTFVV